MTVVDFKARREPPKDPDGRPAQCDTKLEAEIVAYAISKEGAYDIFAPIVRAEHFSVKRYELIWLAIEALSTDGVAINATSVRVRLHATGDLKRIQTQPSDAVIERLVLENKSPFGFYNATGPIATLQQAASRIRDLWRQRELGARAWEIVASTFEPCGNVQGMVETSVAALEDLAYAIGGGGSISIKESIRYTFENLVDKDYRLLTGLKDLDAHIVGLRGGETTIIAARPGMGKTSLAMEIALSIAGRKPADGAPRDGVAVFSMEMVHNLLSTRMLCSAARIDSDDIAKNTLPPAGWSLLTKAASRISELPIEIVDAPAMTPLQVRAHTRRIAAEWRRDVNEAGLPKRRLAAIVVDYLQKMDGRSLVAKGGTRAEEVGKCSGALHNLAAELKIPVVILSQVNRSNEKGKDKRPTMADLRESGDIEADADNIWMLYREEYYIKNRTPADKCGLAEINIEKARNGKVGRVFVKFDARYTQFSDWDGPSPDDEEQEEERPRWGNGSR